MKSKKFKTNIQHSRQCMPVTDSEQHWRQLFKLSRSTKLTHVRPPRPMEVKKLIENRVFLGLSRGNNPSK